MTNENKIRKRLDFTKSSILLVLNRQRNQDSFQTIDPRAAENFLTKSKFETYQDNKCPRIIIHERSKGSDDESDDDEDRYSVTSWRKNFSSLSSFSSKNNLQKSYFL